MDRDVVNFSAVVFGMYSSSGLRCN